LSPVIGPRETIFEAQQVRIVRGLKRPVILIPAVVIAVALLFGYFGWWRSRPQAVVDRLVPHSWVLERQSGSIASLCLGSDGECGSIDRAYSTPDPTTAIHDLVTHVQGAGWTMSSPIAYSPATGAHRSGYLASTSDKSWTVSFDAHDRQVDVTISRK